MVMKFENTKPVINLLQSSDKDFFLDCIDEFYNTIEDDRRYEVRRHISSSGRLKPWLIRKLQELPLLHKLKIRFRNNGQINFASMISGDYRIIIPAAFFSRRNYIYMYDVWPRFHRWIFPMLDVLNIKYVFFSARQVVTDYHNKFPKNKCKAIWLPEALNISEYSFLKPEARSIDVLEFGRSYEAYHELIKESLRNNQKQHVYREKGMPVLFDGKAAFTAALAKSKIVICIPSDITHPDRAEYISTMTLRYLQAMASKCLVVGILPSDMEEIFGYVPMVEIDMANAAAQLLDVLENYQSYQSLIERNYEEVKTKHQWKNRWTVIQSKIEENL